MSAYLPIFLILCQTYLSRSFTIVSYTQNEQSYLPGQTLSLTCRADSAWEFCLWKHTNMEKEVVRDCLMEWKRAKGGVSVQTCDDSLTDRISISGDYDSHECGLTITSLQLEDAGNWECEMEEYRFGDWASGDKHTHAFDVDVRLMTTTTTSTTSTTTTISTTSALSSTELSLDDEYESKSAENTHLNDDKDLEEYGYEYSIEHHDYPEYQEDDKMLDSNSTDARSDIPIYDEYVEALAIEDEAQAAVSLGLIAGGVLVIMCLTVAAALGGVFWNRKRKSIGVVTLHKIKDNSAASESFLEDSEYQVSIMGDPEEEN